MTMKSSEEFKTPRKPRKEPVMPPVRRPRRVLAVQWDEDMHSTRRTLDF